MRWSRCNLLYIDVGALELVPRCMISPDDLSIARKTARTYGNVCVKWKGRRMRGLPRRSTVNRAIPRPSSRDRWIVLEACAHNLAHIYFRIRFGLRARRDLSSPPMQRWNDHSQKLRKHEMIFLLLGDGVQHLALLIRVFVTCNESR